MFAKLCAKIPDGSGTSPGDGSCCSSCNCEVAMAKCIYPYLEPKKNHTGKATDNRAKMVRLWKEHPGRFCQVYMTTEAAFSAIDLICILSQQ